MNVTIDLAKLRALPFRLKVVAGVIVIDAVFLLSGYLALDSLMADRVALIDQRKASLTQLRRQEADLHKQVDEYPAMHQRYLAALAQGVAVPLDRLALVQATQSAATQYHLSDFHYKLSADATKTENGPHYRTEVDRVVLDNGGLLDTDVEAFWSDVLARTQGHYRVAELSLERTGELDSNVIGNIRRGVSVSTFKAHFDLQWTGLQPIAEGKQ